MPRRDPWIVIALVAFSALLVVALFGSRLAPHEPIYFVVEHGDDPRPYDPGLVFPFGSDVLGRDLFSVVLAGAGATLGIVVLGGLARVAAGLLLALVGAAWRPTRVAVDALAALASSVPATIVALLLVKVFVRADTTVLVFVGALLVTGWAGPYRVLRAELDRLGHQAFTDSAVALGLRRWRIAARHHVPLLAPLLAMNASQQIVASLVLLAELGVIGIIVGPARQIDVSESLSKLRVAPNAAQISELSDWGGLLANSTARTVDSLWTTRWLFIIPGVAFAVAAVLVSTIGFALARRWARRNLFYDLRTRGAGALLLSAIALSGIAAALPDRYPGATTMAEGARASLRSVGDAGAAFAAAGLRPVAADFTIERDTTKIVQTGPAAARVGSAGVDDANDGPKNVRPLLDAKTGGGTVDAPLVFVSRGLSPADYRPQRTSVFSPLDLGTAIADYPDDYARVDVRGKVVVLERLMGLQSARGRIIGPDVETAIDNALKRGPAALLFVDPLLPSYVKTIAIFGQTPDPYARLESSLRITDPRGTPVVVLSVPAANRLLAAEGLQFTDTDGWLEQDSAETTRSRARELAVPGRVDVPLERRSQHVASIVGEVPGIEAAAPRIVVWCVRRSDPDACPDVVDAVARQDALRAAPFVFVDFDPTLDPNANAAQIAAALGSREVALIIVLDGLSGSALRFSSPFGDLIPAVDLYADRAGARHLVTRATTRIDDWVWPGSGAYPDTRAVLAQGSGAADDLRADAASLIAYIAGRYILGAEELRR